MAILFEKDWHRFPKAIIDTQTTNESFLRLAAVYQKMGISNNAFHLALLQPELQGIDPFDKSLTDKEKLMVAMEARWNPWYCFRELIRLPPQGGPDPIRFIGSRGNISMAWCFFNHIDYALIQPRQTGKSASVDSLWVTVLFLMATNTTIQLITKDDKLRKENIDRLKRIRDQLPPYLNPTASHDVDNKEMITCIARQNKYITAVGRSDKAAADNLGRGMTSPIIHSDETPYTKNINLSLPVALASGTAARENARMAGGLFCNIFTTTAGKRDTKEGNFAYNLIHDGMYWSEILFDCRDIADLTETIMINSVADKPIINGTFSHKQLGKTDEWLADAIANTRSGGEIADRDFFNIWTSGSESSPLSAVLNDVIYQSEIDPLYVEVTRDNYHLRWYVEPHLIESHMDEAWHLICLDSSNAVGSDSNGLTILDLRTLGVVASASISEANLYKFAKWIHELIIRFPKTVFVIENKSSAQGIIDALITLLPKSGIDPFRRIYSRVIEEWESNPDNPIYKELQRPLHSRSESIYLKYKGKFGFMTTGSSRMFLYDQVLQQAAKTTGHVVRDKRLSSEIRSLVMRNGRVDHPEGGHDDVCVSWLLGHYFARHSRRLDWYGIDPKNIMSHVMDDGAILSEEEIAKRNVISKNRIELESLKDMLKNADTPQEQYRMQLLIQKKLSTIEDAGGTAMSLESIIQEAREAKGKKKKLRDAVRRYIRT